MGNTAVHIYNDSNYTVKFELPPGLMFGETEVTSSIINKKKHVCLENCNESRIMITIYLLNNGKEFRKCSFTTYRNYSWIVIKYKSHHDILCGGSIINERWIITAAHCLEDTYPSNISLVVGEHNQKAVNPFRRKHDVEFFRIHKKYNKLTKENDIALIKTKSNIRFNKNVKPICAPDPDKTYAHQKSQTSGWGHQSNDGKNSNTLKYVTLDITTNKFCREQYGPGIISRDMICTTDNNGMKERDACQNDSGGPLSVKDANNIFSLVGVVSWGDDCVSGVPGVFARVGVQTDWITEMITNN